MGYLGVLLGAIGSGVLFLLALPPSGFGFLTWFCLVPLLVSVHGRGLAAGVLGGIATCLFSAGLANWGIFYERSIPDGDPGWIYTGLVLFGLIFGIIAWLFAETRPMTLMKALGLAGFAVVLELATMAVL